MSDLTVSPSDPRLIYTIDGASFHYEDIENSVSPTGNSVWFPQTGSCQNYAVLSGNGTSVTLSFNGTGITIWNIQEQTDPGDFLVYIDADNDLTQRGTTLSPDDFTLNPYPAMCSDMSAHIGDLDPTVPHNITLATQNWVAPQSVGLYFFEIDPPTNLSTTSSQASSTAPASTNPPITPESVSSATAPDITNVSESVSIPGLPTSTSSSAEADTDNGGSPTMANVACAALVILALAIGIALTVGWITRRRRRRPDHLQCAVDSYPLQEMDTSTPPISRVPTPLALESGLSVKAKSNRGYDTRQNAQPLHLQPENLLPPPPPVPRGPPALPSEAVRDEAHSNLPYLRDHAAGPSNARRPSPVSTIGAMFLSSGRSPPPSYDFKARPPTAGWSRLK